MALKQRLERWIAAGLMDAGQAESILAHEDERGRPQLLYAIAGLAGLAIAIGIVSIVAANWDAIPGRAKIAVDLALVVGLSLGVLRLGRDGPAWARETAILVLYGAVLASIALIGQVYQLGGDARIATTVWIVLTSILMTRASTAFVALIWLAGLQTTYVLWLVWYSERPGELVEGLTISGYYLAPLVCITIGRSAAVVRVRPGLARVFERVGWAEIVLCGSLGTFAFYENADERWRTGLWVGLAVGAGISGWLWIALRASPSATALRALLATSLALAFAPLLFSPGDLDFLGAIAFILLWLCVAYVAHGIEDARLLNLATAIVGIRILIVYFEVFGSLLGTGIGLVIGGVLTLALVWLWIRLRYRFAPEQREGGR